VTAPSPGRLAEALARLAESARQPGPAVPVLADDLFLALQLVWVLDDERHALLGLLLRR
jgi:hypothetical protein